MDLIKTILAVGAGSFLGGAGRYLVSLAMKGVSKGFFSCLVQIRAEVLEKWKKTY